MGYEAFEILCNLNGIKASTVAKATGIASATLSAWKHGTYTPKNDKLAKIAEYFGVPATYFSDVQTDVHKKAYYLNDETAQIAQDIYSNSDLGLLFQASRKLPPEDIKALQTLAQALMRKERQDE